MGAAEITRFLSSLAVEGNVAASTQNQALSALLFLGHRDLSTTMIHTHFLNRGPAGVRSPADRMLAL